MGKLHVGHLHMGVVGQLQTRQIEWNHKLKIDCAPTPENYFVVCLRNFTIDLLWRLRRIECSRSIVVLL